MGAEGVCEWPLNRRMLQEKVLDATPCIPGSRYRPELCQLISRMFAKDPKDRPTADEIISTPWLLAYDRSQLAASVQKHASRKFQDELTAAMIPPS
jgi:serine/threonine protein kinase